MSLLENTLSLNLVSYFRTLLQSLIQIVFLMKKTKSKRKTQDLSPYTKPLSTSISSRFNIKFDLTTKNLSCFIGQKGNYKKTLTRRQPSRKPSKSSKTKKPLVLQSTQVLREKSIQKKRHYQSPDIIKECSNSVLSLIEAKGIRHDWKDQGHNSLELGSEQVIQESNQIWSVFSVNESFQKSHASTMDYQIPAFYHSVQYQNNFYQYDYKQRSQSFNHNVFEIRADVIGYDPRTTIMIRNIPNKYSINDLSEEIDRYFDNTYNFLYLPCDLNNLCNVGYGFINFLETSYLRDFYLTFHNYKWTKFRSQKICNLTYARLQGLSSLIEHFENSKVLNSKEKRYRPIIKSTVQIQALIKNQKLK